MLIYLDWNILDRIEKIGRLDEEENQLYSKLELVLSDETIYVPYSNAHLRDLLKGYKKNPEYITGHLGVIEKITNNLCICQYWGHKNSTWHYRPVADFFDELKDEKGDEEDSFEDLIDWDTSGLWELQKRLLAMLPVPKEFKLIFAEDPIFNIIYPRTKKEMTVLALCSDLHNFSILINKDYSLYKSLKQFLMRAMNKLKKNPQIIASLKSVNKEKPNYLEIDSILDEFTKNQKIQKDNVYYHKILDTFFRFDIKGYKSDGQFPNMIDDGLHTFYAAHCDVFLTNDDRCKYKAEKTFERLEIGTRVFTANDFIEEIEKMRNLE